MNLPKGARSLILMDDRAVIKQLRDLNEPKCYFGETASDRRTRLAKCLAKLTPEERHKLHLQSLTNNLPIEPAIKLPDKVTYTEGTEELCEARKEIANYSIEKCSARLDMSRLKQLEPLATRLIPKQDLIEGVRQIEDLGSYIDEHNSSTELKTLTSCSINPASNLLATSCRSGRCKLWTIADMETHLTLKGHPSNANFITFSPKSGVSIPPAGANLASCAMDGSISLWNLIDMEAVCKLCIGPQAWRTTRVRYHPSGDFLSSCCSDKSWRLWDLRSQKELLRQDGHSDGVFDIAFHPDGSLAGSAGMDSFGRVWDLRLGKSIQLLEGHTSAIRTIDFSPDGYHIATGSLDNSVKIWNLRQRRLEYTIPAHLNGVTSAVFEKTNGFYLITSSLDKTIKFWSNQTWAPIKTLDAFDDKVSNFDISCDNKYLASCCFKYIKLWSIG